VLAWRLSNTLTAHFCVDALEEAMRKYEQPEIFNTDHGLQSTGDDWIPPLKTASVAISMDGKGCGLPLPRPSITAAFLRRSRAHYIRARAPGGHALRQNRCMT